MNFLERALDGQNQFWKYLVVFVAVFLASNFIGIIPLLIVVIAKTIANGGALTGGSFSLTDFSSLGISKNLMLLLMVIPFVIGLITAVLLLKTLHQRTFTETVNGTKKFRISRCLTGAVVWIILSAAYLWIDHTFNGENYVLQLNLSAFIPLFLIVIVFIPFQTTFEEILFRGYLAQGIAGWTKNRWLAILIPGILFGLMHLANPEVAEYGFWRAMPQYVYFGLFFGLVAVLDDGIELPMGIHAANNIFLSLMTTTKSSALQTDAVFEQVNIDPTKETILLIVSSLIAIVFFATKYKWNFNVLNQSVK